MCVCVRILYCSIIHVHIILFVCMCNVYAHPGKVESTVKNVVEHLAPTSDPLN